MGTKTSSYSNVGSLNLAIVSAHRISIANFWDLATLKLAILLTWVKRNAIFGFSDPKLLDGRSFDSITIQKVLFLRFTEVQTTEFQLF